MLNYAVGNENRIIHSDHITYYIIYFKILIGLLNLGSSIFIYLSIVYHYYLLNRNIYVF